MMNMPVVQKSMGFILRVAGVRESKQVVFEGCLIRVKWTLLAEGRKWLVSVVWLVRAFAEWQTGAPVQQWHSRTRLAVCSSLLAFSSILSTI
jgi:hypothetical protein